MNPIILQTYQVRCKALGLCNCFFRESDLQPVDEQRNNRFENANAREAGN